MDLPIVLGGYRACGWPNTCEGLPACYGAVYVCVPWDYLAFSPTKGTAARAPNIFGGPPACCGAGGGLACCGLRVGGATGKD